jgi:bifunctional non-homologous end joining protein LigD
MALQQTKEVRAGRVRRAKSPGAIVPFRVRPMLATLVEQPFDKPDWVYEEKYDGYRLLAYREGKHVSLMSRNDIDYAATYPEVAAAIASLRQKSLLLDGEVVVFDRKNVSRFQLLQQSDKKRVYAVFDCLYVDGEDFRRQPLSARREVLERTIKPNGTLIPSRRLASNGLQAYKVALRRNYEGLIAKDLSSPYIEARSSYWRKVKVKHEDEFIIVGYTAPAGARSHFGALLLGAHHDGKLHYAGKVGTGFNQQSLTSLYKTFQPLVRKTSPLADPPRVRDVTYLKPKLVAQIAYQEMTSDRKLRQPVFLGLRNDKSAADVLFPEIPA